VPEYAGLRHPCHFPPPGQQGRACRSRSHPGRPGTGCRNPRPLDRAPARGITGRLTRAEYLWALLWVLLWTVTCGEHPGRSEQWNQPPSPVGTGIRGQGEPCPIAQRRRPIPPSQGSRMEMFPNGERSEHYPPNPGSGRNRTPKGCSLGLNGDNCQRKARRMEK
jgi:hypothetical protein